MQKKLTDRIVKVVAAAVISGGIFLNSVPAVQAAAVKDIAKSSAYAREAVQWMADNDIIGGDKNGYFNPAKKISRAELVTIIVNALNIDTVNLPETPTFSDVPKSHWAYRYVEAAFRAGIVSGIGNGKFGINNMSTREQVTAILMNCLSVSREAVLAEHGVEGLNKYKDEERMSDWAKASIQFAVSNNLMSGTATDTFSPAGMATKEQIAVILYNFIKNKESLNQAAENLRKPVITFNGDILMLSEAPEIINGAILVPTEAFEKMGADVTVDQQKSKIVIKSATVTGSSIQLQTGKTTAYVNYNGSGDPFSELQAQSNAVTLAEAPKISGNDVLVPVKAVAEVIGFTADWNTKTNLVAIKDNTNVKYPILFNAFKNLLNYKGEYKTTMDMSLVDPATYEEILAVNYSMEGAVNGTNSTSKSEISADFSGQPGEKQQNEVVNTGGQFYSKNMETGEWSAISKAEADNTGIMYYDSAADKAETQKMLDMYSQITVIPAGKSVINGEQVSKYQIRVGVDMLNDLIPKELFGEDFKLEEIYNKGLTVKNEIYVNNQGQIVKQTVKLSAGVKEDYFEVQLNMLLNSEYTNIGKDIDIVSPV